MSSTIRTKDGDNDENNNKNSTEVHETASTASSPPFVGTVMEEKDDSEADEPLTIFQSDSQLSEGSILHKKKKVDADDDDSSVHEMYSDYAPPSQTAAASIATDSTKKGDGVLAPVAVERIATVGSTKKIEGATAIVAASGGVRASTANGGIFAKEPAPGKKTNDESKDVEEEEAVMSTLPHLLAHLAVEQAVEQKQEESPQVGKTITVDTHEPVKKKNSSKKAASSDRKAAPTNAKVEVDGSDDEEDDGMNTDEENGMTTISLANDSQATEVTSNLLSAKDIYARNFRGSYNMDNQNAPAADDGASIATDLAEADGTDHSVYEYVVHAYKSAKENEKVSFVDLYWDETEKRKRAEEERARALQGAEDPETGSSSSKGKDEIDEDGNRNWKKPPKGKLVCCLQIYVAVMLLAIIAVGTVCGGLGMCVIDRDDAANEMPLVPEVEEKPFLRKPFYSRQELINAIDQHLIDPGMVPAVYSLEGIGKWDVSQVTDFSYVFSVRRNEKVIDMNEDLSGWNTSSAENMNSMFLGAEKFEGKGVAGWDVSRVKTMVGMFESCTSFDQDLSAWNTSSVEDFSFAFARSSFTGKGISEWSTSSALNMSYAFFDVPDFDADFSKWDTSRVFDLSFMFNECDSFTGKGLEHFDTSNAKDMAQMFEQCPKFKGEMIGDWNTSLVTSLKSMFDRSGFNGDVSKWNTSSVEDMSYMFRLTPFVGNDLSKWDVSKVETFYKMFSASQFDGSLANWSFKKATTVQAMFYESRNFTGQGLSTWTDTEKITDFSYMFFGAWNMAADLSSWNTSSATSMRSMFNEATSFAGGLTSWQVDKVIDFTEMFEEATSFEGDPAMSSWNVTSAWFMTSMFDRSALSQDLCSWGALVPSDVDVTSIFEGTNCPVTIDPMELFLNWCYSCVGS